VRTILDRGGEMMIALELDRLDCLMRAGEDFVPGMVGTVGGHAPGHITPQRDNGDAIAGLVAALESENPEGGKGFWALRAWTMLTWQPAVLAMLAVHELGFAPRLGLLSQRVQGGSVFGYRLPADAVPPVPSSDLPALIARTGQEVRALADELMAALDAVIRIKPVLARRLLADRVLSLMAHASLRRPELDNVQLRGLADCWIAAMGLEGCSGLMAIRLSDGREQLTLDRKACCLDYRRCGAGYCNSCPKQSDEVRIQRMREHWDEHVRAG
jgi:siderophore ferric iron reductase